MSPRTPPILVVFPAVLAGIWAAGCVGPIHAAMLVGLVATLARVVLAARGLVRRPSYAPAAAAALLPGGGLLVAEPRVHVDAGTFADEMAVAREAGFAVRPLPGIRFSHAALLLREASSPDAPE